MSRTQMMATMSSSEFDEWVAYFNIEPFGHKRSDLNAAYICAVITNVFSKRNYKVDKFMPKFYNEEMSADSMVDFFKKLTDKLIADKQKKDTKNG